MRMLLIFTAAISVAMKSVAACANVFNARK